jgi:hypothetical protein
VTFDNRISSSETSPFLKRSSLTWARSFACS